MPEKPIPDNIKNALDKTITDEELKWRIKKLIKSSRKTKFEKFTSSSLFTILFGFILTTLVGTILTYNFTKKQKEADESKLDKERAIEFVNKTTDLLYERYAVSKQIFNSLDRQAPKEELIERKKKFDDVNFQWQYKIKGMQNEAFNLDSSVDYKSKTFLIDILSTYFDKADSVLVEGYDNRIKDLRVNDEPYKLDSFQSKFVDDYLEKGRMLSGEISDALFKAFRKIK